MLNMEKIVQEVVVNMNLQEVVTRAVEEAVIKTVAESVSSSFGSFSPFKKSLEKKIEEQQKVMISKLNVPQFGELSIEVVEQELHKIELQQKEVLRKKVKQRFAVLLGAREVVSIKDLVEPFVESAYKEFSRGECFCEDREPDFEGMVELLGSDLQMVFNENAWGTFGKWITPTLSLSYKDKFSLEFSLSRESSGDSYVPTATDGNLYKISRIAIDGQDISSAKALEGRDTTRYHETEVAELALAVFINAGAIDFTNFEDCQVEHTETESEY